VLDASAKLGGFGSDSESGPGHWRRAAPGGVPIGRPHLSDAGPGRRAASTGGGVPSPLPEGILEAGDLGASRA
jgi:hypothetical protein